MVGGLTSSLRVKANLQTVETARDGLPKAKCADEYESRLSTPGCRETCCIDQVTHFTLEEATDPPITRQNDESHVLQLARRHSLMRFAERPRRRVATSRRLHQAPMHHRPAMFRCTNLIDHLYRGTNKQVAVWWMRSTAATVRRRILGSASMTPEPKSCSPGECILHEQIRARKMIKWLMIWP